MNIAAITITYNDGYKFKEWVEHYQEYKSELYLHIIVDNGSEDEYMAQLKSTFTDSIIIERGKNGGCTHAYNDGIRYALNDKHVDAIMLIGNDIKLSVHGVKGLYDFLMSNAEYGMVEPILLAKDSDIVEDFGNEISRYLQMKPFAVGQDIGNLTGDEVRTVFTVTGGMNLAKREFYEIVGLQDDLLFMYSDVVDMGIRAKHCGFTMAVTKNIQAWHQHINPGGTVRRQMYTSYLIGRNKVYLANKHFGRLRQVELLLYHFFLFIGGYLKNIRNREAQAHLIQFIKGSWNGLIGKMSLVGIIKGY